METCINGYENRDIKMHIVSSFVKETKQQTYRTEPKVIGIRPHPLFDKKVQLFVSYYIYVLAAIVKTIKWLRHYK